jgi:hypothetical protein
MTNTTTDLLPSSQHSPMPERLPLAGFLAGAAA